MDRQKIERSIKGLSEWQMHVQTKSDIDTNISTAIEALKAQLSQEGTTSDMIDRQQAIDALQKCRKHCIDPFDSYHIDIQDAENQLSKVPTVQPERKMGRWLPDNRPGGGFWVCSECKFPSEAFAADVLYKFCPNCGADMRGGQNG